MLMRCMSSFMMETQLKRAYLSWKAYLVDLVAAPPTVTSILPFPSSLYPHTPARRSTTPAVIWSARTKPWQC